MNKTTGKVLVISAALALLGGIQQATAAAVGDGAYLTDTNGEVVRNATGLCWRTSAWTPAKAIPGCEGGKKVVQTSKGMTLGADDLFDSGKADLKPAAKANLKALAEKMKGMDIESVTVTGHTDSVGSDANNQKLSERRAASVKAYLVKQGVAAGKIKTKGMGETQPVASNKTKEGRAKNRRVNIEVVGVEK